MNSRFCVIWARMNHFETRLMVLSQKVDSKVLRMAIIVREYWWREKNKMATEIVQILRNKVWYTGIQSPHFYKWTWILNWSKWILLVDIPTQIVLSIESIDHSSRCKLDVYAIHSTHQREAVYNKSKIFRNVFKAINIKKSAQNLIENIY